MRATANFSAFDHHPASIGRTNLTHDGVPIVALPRPFTYTRATLLSSSQHIFRPKSSVNTHPTLGLGFDTGSCPL